MKIKIFLMVLTSLCTFIVVAQTPSVLNQGIYDPANGRSTNLSESICYPNINSCNFGATDEAGVVNGATYIHNFDNNDPVSTSYNTAVTYGNIYTGFISANQQVVNQFTISFSFKLMTERGDQYISNGANPGGLIFDNSYSSSSQQNNGMYIGVDGNKGVYMMIDNQEFGTNIQLPGLPGFAPDSGVWYHTTLVFDKYDYNNGYNSSMKIYINNVLKKSFYATYVLDLDYIQWLTLFCKSYPNPDYNPNLPFSYTNRPALLSRLYRGAIDEIRLYDRVLTEQEMTEVYNARLSSPYPTISGFSPSSAAPGTTVTITGNNFSSATAVNINGQSATFNVVNNNTISATMPGGGGRTEANANSAAVSITSVNVTNSSGAAQYAGASTPTPPAAIIKISGSTTACGLSVNDSALYKMTSADNAEYVWSSNTSNIILSSGQGNDSLFVKFKPTFSTGSITCTRIANNDTIIRNIAINKRIPSRPTSILGNKNVCAYVGSGSGTTATYRVRVVQGATSYLWTLPDSVRVSGNANAQVSTADTFINVVFRSTMAPDTIRVRAINACGSSTDALLGISVVNPTFTSVVYGATDACPSMVSDSIPAGLEVTYRVRKTANINSYEWVVPTNVTIVDRPGGIGTANDTIIKVIFGAQFNGGSIQVRGISGCFTTPYRSVYVYKRVPSTRSISTTLISSCPTRQYRYSISPIAYAIRYEWSVPSNASIVGRTDTTFILVNYTGSASGSADYVKVRGINNCSIGNWSQVRVSLPVCSATQFTFSKTTGNDVESSPRILQNPSNSYFTLEWPSAPEKSIITIMDASGRKISVFQNNGQRIQTFGSAFKPGAYFVLIQNGEKRYRFTVIKE